MAIALTGVFSTINAQKDISDEALSAKYKHEISVLESEVKTVKLKLKVNKSDSDLQTELAKHQSEIKSLKAKKKTVDGAIKSKKAADKAKTKAEKALRKSESDASDVQQLKNKQAISEANQKMSRR